MESDKIEAEIAEHAEHHADNLETTLFRKHLMLTEIYLESILEPGGVLHEHDDFGMLGRVFLCRENDGSYLVVWSDSLKESIYTMDGLLSYEGS